jgi:AcrR family transcriptional regulator
MPQQGRRNADQALLVALACGATVEAAARNAGVSQATVYRRLQDPEFQKRVQQVRSDMVQRTAGMLTAASMEAVKTLLELQKTPVPAAVRLGAARSVIELGTKLRETAEFEARLAILEQHMGPKEKA